MWKERIDMGMEIDGIWKKLKEGITIVAEEICGKDEISKKQNWMNQRY